MSTAIVVNALVPGARWTGRIGGADPAEELRKKLLALAPAGDLHAVVHEEDAGRLGGALAGFAPILVRDRRARELFRVLGKALAGYDDALYLFADAPLLDTRVAKSLLDLHREEFAEYTYGEGFPVGVAPEVLQVSLFPKLAALMEKDDGAADRGSLFAALSREINSFDVETLFAPENLKMRRIELSTALKRNRLLVERVVAEKGYAPAYGELCALFMERPGILRTVPSFVEVEITNRVSSPCVYSPLPLLARERGEMDLPRFREIVGRLEELSGELTLSLSYLGEPLLNPEIRGAVEHLASKPGIRTIVETDGVLLDPRFADFLAGLGPAGPTVIFDLDATRDETYAKIRGGELRKAERNVRYLLGRRPENVYVQMVRMDSNEGEMLRFFDLWEKEGARVIIQKYNSVAGLLPELSSYDIKPLDRFPCWHLERDLVIFRDGAAPRCKQDLNGRFRLGNVLEEDPRAVWERGEQHYLRHCEGRYDDQCGPCDEFFTFNF